MINRNMKKIDKKRKKKKPSYLPLFSKPIDRKQTTIYVRPKGSLHKLNSYYFTRLSEKKKQRWKKEARTEADGNLQIIGQANKTPLLALISRDKRPPISTNTKPKHRTRKRKKKKTKSIMNIEAQKDFILQLH